MEVALTALWWCDGVSWYAALMLYTLHWWRCDNLLNGLPDASGSVAHYCREQSLRLSV